MAEIYFCHAERKRIKIREPGGVRVVGKLPICPNCGSNQIQLIPNQRRNNQKTFEIKGGK